MTPCGAFLAHPWGVHTLQKETTVTNTDISTVRDKISEGALTALRDLTDEDIIKAIRGEERRTAADLSDDEQKALVGRFVDYRWEDNDYQGVVIGYEAHPYFSYIRRFRIAHKDACFNSIVIPVADVFPDTGIRRAFSPNLTPVSPNGHWVGEVITSAPEDGRDFPDRVTMTDRNNNAINNLDGRWRGGGYLPTGEGDTEWGPWTITKIEDIEPHSFKVGDTFDDETRINEVPSGTVIEDRDGDRATKRHGNNWRGAAARVDGTLFHLRPWKIISLP